MGSGSPTSRATRFSRRWRRRAAPVTLAPIGGPPRGAGWGPDDMIFFAMGALVEAEGGRLRPSTPLKLVDARYFVGRGGLPGRTYDVAPDGARFLMIKEGGDSTDTPAPAIVVVQHWVEELKKLVRRN